MNTTQQLTIRGVDDKTKKLLIARARQLGMSLNTYNLELLRREVGTSSTKTTNGLERFIGITQLETTVEEALRDQHRATPDKLESYGL